MRSWAMMAAAIALATGTAHAEPLYEGQTGTQIENALTGKDTVRADRMADIVTRHPEAVNPFAYAFVVGSLMRRADKLRASFWFYVMQVRTRPWAKTASDPSGYPALRASLMEQLGSEVNGWLGADLTLVREVPRRAAAFERRVPLFARRPDGVDEATWRKIVAADRDAYTAEMTRALGTIDPLDWAKRRRENGLPVGPLTDGGTPLAEEWR